MSLFNCAYVITALNGFFDETALICFSCFQAIPNVRFADKKSWRADQVPGLSPEISKKIFHFTNEDWFWFCYITNIQLYSPGQYFTETPKYVQRKLTDHEFNKHVETMKFFYSRRKFTIMTCATFRPNGCQQVCKPNSNVVWIFDSREEATQVAKTYPRSFVIEHKTSEKRGLLQKLLPEYTLP